MFKECLAISQLYVAAKNPPVCGFSVFNNPLFSQCTLFVPEEALTAYKSADTWKEFLHIEAYSDSGIEDISAEEISIQSIGGRIMLSEECQLEVFSLNSFAVYRGVSQQISDLAPGVYFVRIGNKTQKVMVR